MSVEVLINMENINALSTTAMLTAYLGSKDYLDIISPFVLYPLPETEGEIVDLSQIQDYMNVEFGFKDIPVVIITRILRRYRGEYVEVRDGEFYVIKPFDRASFDKNRRRAKELINSVIVGLKKYINEEFSFADINEAQVKDHLIAFFETYGLAYVRDIDRLDQLSTSDGKFNYYIAKYILHERDEKSVAFDNLIEITKGFLTQNAIYYFSKTDNGSLNSKFKDVTFYLDCSLVIDIIGYDTDIDYQSVSELVSLIKENGGRVKVLDSTVEEVSALLHAFASQPFDRNRFKLDGLKKMKIDDVLFEALSDCEVISSQLEKLGIKTEEHIYYEESAYEYVEDEDAIISWLKEHSIYRTSSRGYEYDARSLSSISILRKGIKTTHIEKCKAILVTQSTKLNKCMHSVNPKRFDKECDFTILDSNLISIMWLKNFNAKTTLPQEILIANAMTAIQPSQEIMDRTIEISEYLVEKGDLSEKLATLIRAADGIDDLIFMKTFNDIEDVTSDVVFWVADILSDNLEAYEAGKNGKAKDTKQLRKINRGTSSLKVKRDAEIAKRDSVIAKKDSAIKERDKQLSDIRKSIREKCDRKAKKICGSIAALLILSAIVIICCCIFYYLNSISRTPSLTFIVALVASCVLVVIPIIGYLIKGNKYLHKLSNHLSARLYAKELKKINM